eukprot:Gb_09447 [translate_table: standard]
MLHVFDAVYTRMGASDSIQHGSSTFFDELSETSSILQKSTPRSLVIVDELGRGTSTHDGVAIAYATLHYLLKERRCLTLFVTHYPKIVEIKDEFPGEVSPYYVSYLADDYSVKERLENEITASSASQNTALEEPDAYQNTVKEVSQNITFLYKLVPGVASRSFGLHVARLAQLPDSCLKQAAIVAAKLEREVSARVLARSGAKSSTHSATSEEQSQIARLLNGENDNESSVALGGSLLSSNEETIALETECIPDIYEISKLLRCVESALKEISPVDVSCALKRAHKHALQILKSGIL